MAKPNPDIWYWADDEYKVHCPDHATYKEILSWSGSKPGGVYHVPSSPKELDAIIVAANLDRARALLQQKNGKKPAVEPQRLTKRKNTDFDRG